MSSKHIPCKQLLKTQKSLNCSKHIRSMKCLRIPFYSSPIKYLSEAILVTTIFFTLKASYYAEITFLVFPNNNMCL